jgi:hypothetical protein
MVILTQSYAGGSEVMSQQPIHLDPIWNESLLLGDLRQGPLDIFKAQKTAIG